MQLCVVHLSGNIPFEFTFDVMINGNIEQPPGSSKSLIVLYVQITILSMCVCLYFG